MQPSLTMRRLAATFLLAACGGAPVAPVSGDVDCFEFEHGDACSVDQCCDDALSCWYEADDGASWACATGLCTDDEGEAARAYCEVPDIQVTPDDTCRWEGSWAIGAAWCGSFEVQAIHGAYQGTEITFATAPEGGCAVDIHWEHLSGCRATERWDITADDMRTPRDMAIDRAGLTSCDPAGCELGDGSTPVSCAVGARAGVVPAVIVSDGSDAMTITGAWSEDVLPFCAMNLEITLVKL